MWSTLIGLIERWRRERPRRDVISGVVYSTDSMIDCQISYSVYREALKAGDLDTRSPDPRVEWIRSVGELSCQVTKLGAILPIFSPEAYEAVSDFLRAEGIATGTIALEYASEELLEFASAELQPLDLDIENVSLSTAFSDALNRLREFMVNNFKPEEISAASKVVDDSSTNLI